MQAQFLFPEHAGHYPIEPGVPRAADPSRTQLGLVPPATGSGVGAIKHEGARAAAPQPGGQPCDTEHSPSAALMEGPQERLLNAKEENLLHVSHAPLISLE